MVLQLFCRVEGDFTVLRVPGLDHGDINSLNSLYTDILMLCNENMKYEIRLLVDFGICIALLSIFVVMATIYVQSEMSV